MATGQISEQVFPEQPSPKQFFRTAGLCFYVLSPDALAPIVCNLFVYKLAHAKICVRKRPTLFPTPFELTTTRRQESREDVCPGGTGAPGLGISSELGLAEYGRI